MKWIVAGQVVSRQIGGSELGKYFEGWYLKHQTEGQTLALIPGRSADKAFIQVVTEHQAYDVCFPLQDYERTDLARIGNNIFSCRGIQLDIHTEALALTGHLQYTDATPIKGDIMGPFQFLPMECRHCVISMNHALQGVLTLNGETIDFSGGTGYIEGDRGRSFPRNYVWVQSNDFEEECSIMAAVAQIPFAGFWFWGCICVIWHQNKEYRLATYLGARTIKRTETELEIRQGQYRLIVEVEPNRGHALAAPQQGFMVRTIHESPSLSARFRFMVHDHLMIDSISKRTSYECML